MGFMRLMAAMIFVMLFGYWDHKNVSLFLEYLGSLKRKEEKSSCLYRSYITYMNHDPVMGKRPALALGWGNLEAGRSWAISQHPGLTSYLRKLRPRGVFLL
jgi:hypothetical protein